MKKVSRGIALAVPLGVLAVSASGLAAQDACPRASGADAEAGWTAYAANDMERAGARFRSALTRCPDDDYARTGLGYVLLRAGEVEGAAELWRAVVEVQPNNVDALVGLGLVAWRLGDLEEVQMRFEHVVQLVPDHATAKEYLERVEGSLAAAARPPDPADVAWAEGETERAFDLYVVRLREDANDLTAALRVALVLAWRGQYDESLGMLDDILAREPMHVDARLAHARVRAWAGDVPAAQREVLDILAVQPDNAEALEALGLFQAWSGDLESAIEVYEGLNAIAPQSGVGARQRAQALAWSSRYEAATTAYEALLERDPEDVDARLGLAQALAYRGDFTGSIEQYDRVLASSPEEVRALMGKARALGWAGRLVEAERVAEQAVTLDEYNAGAWAGLGQLYRWQGRDAAARRALETASMLAPTSAEVLDQLRSVNQAFAPVARPSVTYERDSDGNRMLTTSLASSWHPIPRLDVRASGYRRALELGLFQRTAQGVTVEGRYQLEPGWSISAGLGGSESDGLGDPSFFEYRAGVRTPERHPWVGGLSFASIGLNETAALAQRGVRSTELVASLRWTPDLMWRFDGTVGVGSFEGAESNGRRSASLAASRRLGRFFSAGASFRAFSFEKDLDEGYFDPDFYGVLEATSHWLYRPGDWILLAELAPGLQRVRSDGDTGASLRTNLRVAYSFGVGREVSLSFGYSSAGLVSFATGRSGYSYTAVVLGAGWTF